MIASLLSDWIGVGAMMFLHSLLLMHVLLTSHMEILTSVLNRDRNSCRSVLRHAKSSYGCFVQARMREGEVGLREIWQIKNCTLNRCIRPSLLYCHEMIPSSIDQLICAPATLLQITLQMMSI